MPALLSSYIIKEPKNPWKEEEYLQHQWGTMTSMVPCNNYGALTTTLLPHCLQQHSKKNDEYLMTCNNCNLNIMSTQKKHSYETNDTVIAERRKESRKKYVSVGSPVSFIAHVTHHTISKVVSSSADSPHTTFARNQSISEKSYDSR